MVSSTIADERLETEADERLDVGDLDVGDLDDLDLEVCVRVGPVWSLAVSPKLLCHPLFWQCH